MKTKRFDSVLEFTNSGNLSLFFLGTGSAFSKKYMQTNVLVVKGNDHVLIDCGSLCPFSFARIYNSDISNIKNIFVTHPHSDHIGGLEEVALQARYVSKHKINLILDDEFKDKLWNESLRGGLQYSETGVMKFEDYFEQLKPVTIIKKPYIVSQINVGSINLKIFRTYHVTTQKWSLKNAQYSQGVIIDDKILYPCDTQFNTEQLKFLMETFPIEYIFHDCDTSGYSEGVHATYDQLKTLPEQIKSKMYLCHYGNDAAQKNPKADGFAGFAKAATYYEF